MSEQTEKSKITDPTRVITLANGLSVLRAFLAFPIVYYLSLNEMPVAIVLILLAVLSDYLDGLFARRAHEITNLGKMLDPVADKIVIFAVTLFLVLDESRPFPLWFLVLYVVRDLSISLSSLYILNRYSVSLPANRTGKWSVGISALAIFLYVVNAPEWKYYLLLSSALLIVTSWIQYAKRNLAFMRRE